MNPRGPNLLDNHNIFWLFRRIKILSKYFIHKESEGEILQFVDKSLKC